VRVFRESLHGGELNEPRIAESEAAEATGVDQPVEVAAAEDASASPEGPAATHRVRITDVEIDHPGLLLDRDWLLPDEAMTVRVKYHASERTDDMLFGIAIYDENGNNLYGTNTSVLGVDVPVAVGDQEMAFEFPRVPLLDGRFLVTIAIQSRDEGTVYDWREQQTHFQVMNPDRTHGLVSFPIEVHFGETAMEHAEGTGA